MLALVLIPTVTAIVLGGVRIQAARDTAGNFAQVNQLAALSSDVTALANAIEDERDLTAGWIAANQAGDGADAKNIFATLSAQYALTGARLAVVQRAAAQIGPSYPAVARTDLTFALSRLTALTDLRGLAHSEIQPLPMITEYSGVISPLLAFDDEIATGNSSAELSQTVNSLGSLAQMEDEVSQQRAILYGALTSGGFGPGDLSALVSAQSSEASSLATYQTAANALPAYTPGAGFSASLTEEQQFNNDVAGPNVDDAQSIEQNAVIDGDNGQGLASGDAPVWFSDMTTTLDDIRDVEETELASIGAQASTLHQGATSSERLTAVVVLILLLLVLVVTTVMARSMIIPLRRLRTDALDVAGRRLPDIVQRLSQEVGEPIQIEPIGIDSTDEIGEVARAFDQVHGEAVRLAGEEALLRANLNAMFVNLSRRSQSLIERQLGIIETLEQSEQDSSRLSSLFRLDHLATRMRRNSENLLVLAGHEAPRKWTKPVPLVDVLRAAISEIEQYERITLNVQSALVIAGRAASDVVHLVAELAENATTFSREDTQVRVTGQLLSSGGVLVEITDEGLGIPEQELAHANWRLDNPPVIDVAVSRRMGLFVVGRLAARHGIKVRLRRAGGGGLSALIWVPETVAEAEQAQPLGPRRARPGNGTAPVMAQVTPLPVTVAGPAPVVAGPGPAVSSSWFGGRPATGPLTAQATARITPEPYLPEPYAPELRDPQPLPSAAESAADTRLPIYDSVESDWFRRGAPLNRAEGRSPAGSWTSPADEGFRAAQSVVSPATDSVTTAGLPKRVPSANLVPGSVGSRPGPRDGQAPPPAQVPARSPEAVRARMSGFQARGRAGRADAPRDSGTDEN